jgi:hypothetical protein
MTIEDDWTPPGVLVREDYQSDLTSRVRRLDICWPPNMRDGFGGASGLWFEREHEIDTHPKYGWSQSNGSLGFCIRGRSLCITWGRS